MTTVSLSELLSARDDSLRIRRTPWHVRMSATLRRIDLRPALRIIAAGLLATLGFVTRHGLVIAGCMALVIGAATLSITAAWITTAAALFFLEARRR